jgi:hypothetical protein
MCLGIPVCCTVCCSWRASLRGIAIRARSSRTIKIIQWSGRRSPLRRAWLIACKRSAGVLDVRVAEKADSTARSNWCRARTGGTAGVHQQADSERSELFADAKGRIDRNHVYGQRPNNGPSHPSSGAAPGAYSMSDVVGHRVHGEDPTQNANGTSDKLMLVMDNGRGMATSCRCYRL